MICCRHLKHLKATCALVVQSKKQKLRFHFTNFWSFAFVCICIFDQSHLWDLIFLVTFDLSFGCERTSFVKKHFTFGTSPSYILGFWSLQDLSLTKIGSQKCPKKPLKSQVFTPILLKKVSFVEFCCPEKGPKVHDKPCEFQVLVLIFALPFGCDFGPAKVTFRLVFSGFCQEFLCKSVFQPKVILTLCFPSSEVKFLFFSACPSVVFGHLLAKVLVVDLFLFFGSKIAFCPKVGLSGIFCPPGLSCEILPSPVCFSTVILEFSQVSFKLCSSVLSGESLGPKGLVLKVQSFVETQTWCVGFFQNKVVFWLCRTSIVQSNSVRSVRTKADKGCCTVTEQGHVCASVGPQKEFKKTVKKTSRFRVLQRLNFLTGNTQKLLKKMSEKVGQKAPLDPRLTVDKPPGEGPEPIPPPPGSKVGSGDENEFFSDRSYAPDSEDGSGRALGENQSPQGTLLTHGSRGRFGDQGSLMLTRFNENADGSSSSPRYPGFEIPQLSFLQGGGWPHFSPEGGASCLVFLWRGVRFPATS